MAALREKLYWMNMHDHNVDEVGFLMTKKQLLKELPEKITEEQLEEKLSAGGSMRKFEGAYVDDVTFTVREVKDMEDLEDLVTWAEFDFEDSCVAEEFADGVDYPDYVPRKLRLTMCVNGDEPGWTSCVLPKSGDVNPTIQKYAERLGITDMDKLRYQYSKEEQAAIVISQKLNGGELDEEEYRVITERLCSPFYYVVCGVKTNKFWLYNKLEDTYIEIPDGLLQEIDEKVQESDGVLSVDVAEDTISRNIMSRPEWLYEPERIYPRDEVQI